MRELKEFSSFSLFSLTIIDKILRLAFLVLGSMNLSRIIMKSDDWSSDLQILLVEALDDKIINDPEVLQHFQINYSSVDRY